MRGRTRCAPHARQPRQQSVAHAALAHSLAALTFKTRRPSRFSLRLAPLGCRSYLPYIGMVTIIMNDYPLLKYCLVGLMGLFVLTSKE